MSIKVNESMLFIKIEINCMSYKRSIKAVALCWNILPISFITTPQNLLVFMGKILDVIQDYWKLKPYKTSENGCIQIYIKASKSTITLVKWSNLEEDNYYSYFNRDNKL
ncbi:unnamed protein product [Paramecium octaurelia]|uniref:Uncharacterized protein n=1 Tax=Paramecium octaurelia TaxID=43137 RepID=A0A8S1X3G2_PAROT|nr:unnamed protein product [Paramecium octaurelia]